MGRSTPKIFPGVPETPLQFIFVTSLSSIRYSYHLWLLVITKSRKNITTYAEFEFHNPGVVPLK